MSDPIRNGAAFADTLKVAAEQAYGSAGQAFVKALIPNQRVIRSIAEKFFRDFEARATSQLATGAHGQDKRVIKRFALIALAGLLATKFRLTGWNTDAARDAALSVLNDWQDGQSTQNEGGEQTLEKTKVYLSAHAAQLIHLADPAAPVPINPISWRDATQVYLPQSTWHDIHPANEATPAAKNLMDLGVILPGDDTGLTRKAPRTVAGRPRVLVLRAPMVLEEPANALHADTALAAIASGA